MTEHEELVVFVDDSLDQSSAGTSERLGVVPIIKTVFAEVGQGDTLLLVFMHADKPMTTIGHNTEGPTKPGPRSEKITRPSRYSPKSRSGLPALPDSSIAAEGTVFGALFEIRLCVSMGIESFQLVQWLPGLNNGLSSSGTSAS
ncbi:hypothetical protein QNM99_14905 [Pseudomonas sp. PCH446]